MGFQVPQSGAGRAEIADEDNNWGQEAEVLDFSEFVQPNFVLSIF